MVPLSVKSTAADDSLALMQCVAPQRNQQELEENGKTDFGFALSDQARFRIAAFKRRGEVGMVIRRIPTELFPH
jgi:twitching motility protein PilT